MDGAESDKAANDHSFGSYWHRLHTEILGPIGIILAIVATVFGGIIFGVRWYDSTGRRLDALEAEVKGGAPAIMSSAGPDQRISEFKHELDGLISSQKSTLTYLSALEERINKLEILTSGAAVPSTLTATSRGATSNDARCNSREQWNVLKACLGHPCATDGNSIACTVTFTNLGQEKYFHFGRSDDRTAPAATIYTRRSNSFNSTVVRVGDKRDSGVDIIDNYSVDVTYSFIVPSSEDHINTMAILVWSANGPALQDNDMLLRVNDVEIVR
jgi:hypothetical protein